MGVGILISCARQGEKSAKAGRCGSVRHFLRFRWSEEVAESSYQQKALTTVTLASSAEEPPIEPVEVDEQQRIFGFTPTIFGFTPTTIIPGSGLDASGNRGGCS
jgi:hypothetical protein